nr:hypothetical protein [Tanacetum cinerariifolium]
MKCMEQALPLMKVMMYSVASWNIRGMDQTPKQSEVRQVINENSLSFSAILESHVLSSRLDTLCSHVFRSWDWTSNGNWCSKGTRIILGWNPIDVSVSIITQDDQVMHTRIWFKADKKELFCSPWCLLGDFNAALNLEDYAAGSFNIDIFMREFKECVEDIHVSDPYRISDHSPTILKLPMSSIVKLKPFKLSNILTHRVRFKEVVKEGWKTHFSGFHMFCVVKKFKHMKRLFRKLLFDHGNLHYNVKRLRVELDRVQSDLDADPFNSILREEEAAYVLAFNEGLIMQESFLKQKLKIEWLRVEDSNSAYFHKAVKGRISRSRIDVVTTCDCALCSNDQVPVAFVNHYAAFLRQKGVTLNLNSHNLFTNTLDIDVAPDTIKTVMSQEAIQEFFNNGTLLKELNHTIIALIPKVADPSRINDYRPISCCNVLFKCISKIIANRIKDNLKFLVSPNQSAFVPCRRISDNILLTQEFMHNYHLDKGPSICAFKVNIQKAYDTVDWDFLKDILVGFGFHPPLIHWIMECVSSTTFSASINGSIHGFLRENVVSVKRRVRDSVTFTYHRYCDKLNIINLCFAGDLFLLAHGDANSAQVIMKALDEFKMVSERQLSIKYLGVPIISSRIIYRDCRELIERVQNRIKDWKNKFLSAAGRILLDIEQLMRGFLWCQGDMHRGKAKVAWDVVCLPKKEGGLGIRKLDCFNKALMNSNTWRLLSFKESLWVRWIHTYKLKGMNFWDIPIRGNMTWGWRKILRLRPYIRLFIRNQIGDGSKVSMWFDRWCPICPLSSIISPHDIHRAGFDMFNVVKDTIVDGQWTWPHEWILRYHILATIGVSAIVPNELDNLEWRTSSGTTLNFSVSLVRECIWARGEEVNWCDVVWFSNCIPRHTFHLWLVIKWKLKTQDTLRQWDVFVGLPMLVTSFNAIIDHIIPMSKKKNARSMIAKLVFAASSYFIWQERNNRLFKSQKRSPNQIIECIIYTVRLKLLTCSFKKTKTVMSFMHLWKLPVSLIRFFILTWIVA